MAKQKLDINAEYEFDDDTMELYHIPKIELINEIPEIWKFVYLDKHKKFNKERKYMISNYGRVFNHASAKMVKSYESIFFKSKVAGYLIVTLRFKDKGKIILLKYLVHRLVALAFLPKSKNRKFVNHKDGDPRHPYVWNLEWSTPSENYIHALTSGLKLEKYGEERSNSLWSNDEIHLICRMMELGHKATFIFHELKTIFPDDPRIQYERIRSLVKHIKHKTHWTFISDQYNIDTTKFDYAKEQSSVQNAKYRNIDLG